MEDDLMGGVVGPQLSSLHSNQVNMNSSMMIPGVLNNQQNENSMFDEDFAQGLINEMQEKP